MGIFKLESFLNDGSLQPPPPFQVRRSLRSLSSSSPGGGPLGGAPPVLLLVDGNGFMFYALSQWGYPPPTLLMVLMS